MASKTFAARGKKIGWIVLAVLLMASAALFMPLRIKARVEVARGNPIQHIILEGRSMLGLRRAPWRVRVSGQPAWGSPAEGYFISPNEVSDFHVSAFPRFSQTFKVAPSGDSFSSSGLADEGDREAFRRWFVAILEDQLERLSPAWEPAQRDCSGLLRFVFHEAWGPHTEEWRARTAYGGGVAARNPAFECGGPWRAGFPTSEGWKPFAKGAVLRNFSCVFMGRDTQSAKPGDLLFFSRGGAHATPDHAMAFARPESDGMPVLIYHTGREQSGLSRDAGEMRRVRLSDLLQHPDAEFRPLPENPSFLGVYRWRVLADAPAFY